MFHREVRAEVRPTALLPEESALCDESREKVRRGPQPLQSSGVSDQPTVPPERAPHPFVHPSARDVAGVRPWTWLLGEVRASSRKTGFAEGGECCPAAEDETLEE